MLSREARLYEQRAADGHLLPLSFSAIRSLVPLALGLAGSGPAASGREGGGRKHTGSMVQRRLASLPLYCQASASAACLWQAPTLPPSTSPPSPPSAAALCSLALTPNVVEAEVQEAEPLPRPRLGPRLWQGPSQLQRVRRRKGGANSAQAFMHPATHGAAGLPASSCLQQLH